MNRPLKMLVWPLAVLIVLAAQAAGAQKMIASGHNWSPPGVIDAPGRNGVAIVRGHVKNVTIGPMTVTSPYRAIESLHGSTLVDSRIVGVTATELQRDCVRLRYAARVALSGLRCLMRAEPQDGAHLPQGVVIYAGSNITIKDSEFSGFRMKREPGRYANGDGVAVERGVDGIIISGVSSRHNSEAGFDLKGKNMWLDAVTAEGNKRNFGFWTSVKAGTIVSKEARANAIWVKGNPTSPPLIEIRRLVVHQSSPITLIRVDGGPAEIRIHECQFLRPLPPGSRFIVMEAAGKKTLGETCRV